MTNHHLINNEPERAFLVGANLKGSIPLLSVHDSLTELAMLASTAGMVVVGQDWQNIQNIHPATYIGTGKIEEIITELEETEAQVVVFDDELSPRNQRELEKRFGDKYKLLDRSALILDIFAQHAHTREGALQVELAQYEYRLPRLTRQWTHLARQAGGGAARGGVGVRGPGETQLEVDRREIARKITKLKSDLEDVRAHRGRYRAQRTRGKIPVISLVGYTNAGKSTLFRALTGTDVYIADQLFATLDPTTRRIDLPSGRMVLLTDTVGFIQKLPTTLIEAFQATLEEVVEADVIVHVVDTSHQNVLEHIEAVEDTLAELEVPDVPRILVWNKMDLMGDEPLPELRDSDEYEAQAFVSAAKGEGLQELLELIETAISATSKHVKLLMPYERGELISFLHESSTVESQEHTQDGVVIVTQLPPDLYERYKEYEI